MKCKISRKIKEWKFWSVRRKENKETKRKYREEQKKDKGKDSRKRGT
jgi:hypothetical protein